MNLGVKRRSNPGARTVSFSGVDGSGKSTQIERLIQHLESCGVSVRVLRFWDDVATLTRIREGAGHRIFKGDKGVGSVEKPVNRRDKNVRGWPMTGLRLALYLLDALSLRRVFQRSLQGEADFVIFDRYIYDEVANLDPRSWMLRAYIRLLLWIVPRPDISFILDADPEAARARKPEYPLEFIHFNRENYLMLARRTGWLTVIPPGEIELAQLKVREASMALLSTGSTPQRGRAVALSTRDQVVKGPDTGEALL